MIIGQFTDLHIRAPGERAYQRVDTAGSLKRAIAQLNKSPPRPDLLLVTGDLTDWGEPEEYRHLALMLDELKCPFRLLPGNHDDRQALREAFPHHAYLGTEGPIHHALDLGRLLILSLDTTLPGHPEGNLGEGQRNWLERQLARSGDKPVLIAMHHPPFETGIGHMDRIGLRDSQRFAEIIRRYPNVEHIACGHVHRSITTRFAGTVASIAPGVAHQLTVGLEPDAPSCFTDEPGGYQLHRLSERGEIVTHTIRVGDWGGPYPIFDGDVLLR